MSSLDLIPKSVPGRLDWRHVVLAAVALGSLVVTWNLDPIAQDTAYHAFADTRMFLGIPNCLDVLSNLPFLIIGVLGVYFCLCDDPGGARLAWTVMFAGTTLIGLGSAYYHWSPDNGSLVWDRYAMTVAFMGLFVAMIGEYVNPRLVTALLLPVLSFGLASVLYWHEVDDLRFYIWVQFAPLLCIPVMMSLSGNGYTHQWLILAGLGCYVLAKIAEAYDVAIFQGTGGQISGHSIKHLLGATGCYLVLLMLRIRKSNWPKLGGI